MINFKKLGIDTNGRTGGRIKVFCPKCHPISKNKRDKSLSVDLTRGLYNCHRCGFKGCAKDNGHSRAGWQNPGYTTRVKTPARSLTPSGEAPTAPHIQWFEQIRHIPARVLTHMGITSAEEYMPQSGKKESCICFNYFEGGRIVNTKFRTLQKAFKMIQGAELVPYNIDGIEDTPECIITEGEIDALSFAAAGRTDVISVPGGANRNLTWMDRFVESHFENKRIIYIAVDADRKGQELCRELIRRLGVERCRIVRFSAGCKDANEQLVKHGAQSLMAALAQAPEPPLEGVYTAGDVENEMRILFENGLAGGAETGWENFDRYCTFEPGRLCVVTGIPGCGKSEFIDDLVVRLCLRHEWRIAFFSPENMPLHYHLRKLAEKLSGRGFKERLMSESLYRQTMRWMNDNVSSIFPKENFTAQTILSRARELVHRKGVRILVVDPFNRVDHQIPAGQTETQYISAFIDSLTNFAQRNGCLVILVAHPRKMKREAGQLREPVPTLYDINGSAAFFNKCDYGLVVERDRQAGVTRIHVEKVKYRHLGGVGVASFLYNPANGRFSSCEEHTGAAGAQGRITGYEFDCRNWLPKAEDDSDGTLFDELKIES